MKARLDYSTAFATTVATLACLGSSQGAPASAQDKSTAKALRAARNSGFPKSASAYAKQIESILGVPPRVDLDTSVEIPLYVKGERRFGNLGRSCDNPSFLGKDTVSGSTLQRYEGRSATGEPIPHVVWVSFGRNWSNRHDKLVASVQMIGYDRKSGATAFFESSDRLDEWVKLDKGSLRMRGSLPWIDEPEAFDRAF